MKRSIKYILTFLITSVACCIFLFVANLIPQKAISKNIEKSVKSIIEENGRMYYPLIIEENYSTKRDFYGDFMTIKMLHYLDEKHPISSALKTATFEDPVTASDYTLEVVKGNVKSNFDYYRYWHGNLGILKILFTVFNYDQIINIFTACMYILVGIILFLLAKNKKFKFLTFFIIAFLSTYSFVATKSFEYTWMYLLALIFCIIGIFIYKKSDSFIISNFIICGVLTNFLDFLTTETLPVLLLLTTILIFKYDKIETSLKEIFTFSFKCLLAFFLSYCFMWILKWILAAVLFNMDFYDLVKNHIIERMTGFDTISYLRHPLQETFFVNINALFPLNYFESTTLVLTVAIIAIALILIKTITKNMRKIDYIYLLILLLPYLRYTVLMGHSYIHYFFTFRAQFVSIICFLLIIFNGNYNNLLKKEKRLK